MEERIKKIEEKMNNEQKKLIDDILNNQKAIQKELNELKNEIKTANNKNQIILKEFTIMKTELKTVQADNLALKNEIKCLRISTEEMMYARTANEIEIIGLELHGGTINNSLLEMGKVVQLKIQNSDFIGVNSKKVGPKKTEIHTIQFKSLQLRDDFLEKARRKRIKNSDINSKGSSQAIYFNEPLSYYTRKVFNEARKLKQEKGYKFIWTKKGKVYVRKAEKEQAIHVVTMEDIVTLKK